MKDQTNEQIARQYATARNKAVERLRLATAYADDGACHTAKDIARQAIEALEKTIKIKAKLITQEG